jgi:hypothetical protein
MAPVVMSGPFVGTRSDGSPAQVNIQHFIAISILSPLTALWMAHCHHIADVPWINETQCGEKGCERRVWLRRLGGFH